MRICLLAWGSRGDVQPAVALGRGLKAAGHEVTVVVLPQYEALAAESGLTVELFEDHRAVMPAQDRSRWRDGSARSAREERRLWRSNLAAVAPGVADRIAGLLDGHDAFISGLVTFPVMFPITRRTGKPHIIAFFTPNAPTRSGAASMSALRPDSDSVLNLLAGWVNRTRYTGFLWSLTQASRARLDLPRYTLRQFTEDAVSTPALLAVSPALVPVPPDASGRSVTTGCWIDPLDPGYRPPPDLDAFVADGPPPVCVGFGSLQSAGGPQATVELVVTALRRAGCRGVIQGAWDGWRPDGLPDDVVYAEPVPHEWLFPRAAAVVHHGGAGHTVTAARAGVPQFVVPHMGDQPYWGRRVAQLGLGPVPVRRRDLDVDRLAAALTRMTTDEVMRARAYEFGHRVRAEDGVAAAVAAVDRLLTG